MITSLDIFLICLAVTVMLTGFYRVFRTLKSALPETCHGARRFLLFYLLHHKIILEKPLPGLLHLLVFYGCMLPVVIIILAQTPLTMPEALASGISFLLDTLGLLFLAGAVMFFIKRLISRDALGPKKSLLPLFLLILILFSGFMAAGIRLSIVTNAAVWASPIGYMLSLALPASPVMMQVIIRTHLYLVMLLIALAPFTFFRHLVLAPVNIIYKKQGSRGGLRAVSEQGTPGANHGTDFSWKQLLETEACVSCGRCEQSCPAFISGKPLSPRKVVRAIQDFTQSDENSPIDSCISSDEIWSCTTCMACVEACPVYAVPLDKIIEIRRYLFEGKGDVPQEAIPMIRALELYGDVNGKGASLRADWAMNRGVKIMGPGERDVEIVIWTGCSGAFHPRYQDVSRALVSILQKAGINFRILGTKEACCGDPARRLGNEELFKNLAEKNLRMFREHNVNRIITLCPHCFNTLKNEYPGINTPEPHRFEVIHATEYVMELIDKEYISPEFPLDKKVTVHDPCYLGRGNNIYEPLRGLIKSIPGARLTELARSREKGFCCGAGGGGMWLHENLGKRLNAIRSEEIANKGVDVVCTACPYCQTMLSDGINGLGLERVPQVLDIIEVVEQAVR
ncbi:MAG: (Fe-S)-binding protein [Deltaproteobacteria bacterium]|nr:(Fe-S)-binding protein [Deltaproteobacteria bacterium]